MKTSPADISKETGSSLNRFSSRMLPGNIAQAASTQERLVHCDRFGLVVRVPREWAVTRETDAESETINIIAPRDRAQISIICIDLQMIIPVETFVTYLQEQLQKEMPYIAAEQVRQQPDQQGKSVPPLSEKVIEYTGKYDGYHVKTLARFIVRNKLGFEITGTYGISDRQMQKTVRKAVDSLVIENA